PSCFLDLFLVCVRRDADGNHAIGIYHCTALSRAALDLVDMLHAALDIAHYGVLAVEEIAGREHDEELRVGRVGVLRARHTNGSTCKRFARELRLDVAERRTARASALAVEAISHVTELDVTGLGHETLDH